MGTDELPDLLPLGRCLETLALSVLITSGLTSVGDCLAIAIKLIFDATLFDKTFI